MKGQHQINVRDSSQPRNSMRISETQSYMKLRFCIFITISFRMLVNQNQMCMLRQFSHNFNIELLTIIFALSILQHLDNYW